MIKKTGLLESRRIMYIKTENIFPNPHQPRSIFERAGLIELSESIRQYGILQPLSVRRKEKGDFELIAGERRLRAAKIAGLRDVPCILVEVTEKQSSVLALIENIQRCDLDYFEEAQAIQQLIWQYGLSQEDAARRLGKSQSAVANKLRLLKHPEDVVDMIRRYGLTERHARALLRIESPEDRKTAIAHINEHRLNVAQTEEYIEKLLPEDQLEREAGKNIKTLYLFRDVRLFLNTVTRAIQTMRRSGVSAEMEKNEKEEEIELTIRIPKKVEIQSLKE